jgi:hypothetical protein
LVSLPVGKRMSPSTATESGSLRRRFSLTRASMSPSPVLDPSILRDAVRIGSSGVPPKKCTAGGGPKGLICALLVPSSPTDTSGSATPTSIRSVMP